MKQHLITVRQTKTIRECAVGAICRTASECFVPCDIRFWVDRNEKPIGRPIPLIRDHLKSFLEHKGFPDVNLLQSPTFAVVNDRVTGQATIQGNRIPSVRFPSWMRCLQCGLLHYLPWLSHGPGQGKAAGSVDGLCCSSDGCRGRLEFVTWVLISAEGFLDDIPWSFLAHRDSRSAACGNPGGSLYLGRDNRGRLTLQCRHCGASADNLNGIRNKLFFTGLATMREQPWLKRHVPVSEMKELPVAVKLTDVRVHIPDVVGALDIPPESRIDENDVRARISQLDAWSFMKPLQAVDRNRCRRLIKSTAILLGVSRETIHHALDDLEKGWPLAGRKPREVTSADEMLAAEYQALCTCYDDFNENERFVTEHRTGPWKSLIQGMGLPSHYRNIADAVDRLVIVKRLREVQAFCGFFRKYRGVAPIRPGLDAPVDWLPACELYGEGIFFTLDEEQVHAWEQLPGCIDRSGLVSRRLERSAFRNGPAVPSSRFILLHTIAHLIIKQLEFSAGYPVSSFKEKIFCSSGTSSPMSGILIYLVVPDKMGSLGGLAEHGKPANFLKLWLKAMEKAHYCSYDPICSEHEGQGPDQLNRAACHGCALLPETSCSYSNCLLDRQFVIGSQPGIKGFMTHVQEQNHRSRGSRPERGYAERP